MRIVSSNPLTLSNPAKWDIHSLALDGAVAHAQTKHESAVAQTIDVGGHARQHGGMTVIHAKYQ
jgi:hypothetical protein